MAIYLILDIETLPHPRAGEWLDPVVADKRLKDPAKIDADLAEKTLEREDKLGLDPDTNVIAAIGYHVVGGADPVCLVMENEQEERQNLIMFRDFYNDINQRNDVRTVTFYGFKFDLICLKRRAVYLEVPNFPQFSTDRFRSNHIDVWWELSEHGQIPARSLKFYAKRFGIGTLDKVNGCEITQLVKAGNWDAVEAHCLSDIAITHVLANRLDLLKL